MDTNRAEVLRAFLVCLSPTLYRSPAEESKLEQRVLGMVVDNATISSFFFKDLVTSKKNPVALPLFYSLLNTAVGYDPIGWGLPYVRIFTRIS